jgi:hypothetical protein
MRSALAAKSGSPVSRYCLARAGPTASGQMARNEVYVDRMALFGDGSK